MIQWWFWVGLKCISNYNEDYDEGYFLELDFQCPENYMNLHSNFSFILERMKIEKVEKIIVNLHDKKEYVIHTSLKQALYLGFKKYKKRVFR